MANSRIQLLQAMASARTINSLVRLPYSVVLARADGYHQPILTQRRHLHPLILNIRLILLHLANLLKPIKAIIHLHLHPHFSNSSQTTIATMLLISPPYNLRLSKAMLAILGIRTSITIPNFTHRKVTAASNHSETLGSPLKQINRRNWLVLHLRPPVARI